MHLIQVSHPTTVHGCYCSHCLTVIFRDYCYWWVQAQRINYCLHVLFPRMAQPYSLLRAFPQFFAFTEYPEGFSRPLCAFALLRCIELFELYTVAFSVCRTLNNFSYPCSVACSSGTAYHIHVSCYAFATCRVRVLSPFSKVRSQDILQCRLLNSKPTGPKSAV